MSQHVDTELDLVVKVAVRAATKGYDRLSDGEAVTAALVLNRADLLAKWHYTLPEAIERVGRSWMSVVPEAEQEVRRILQATS